MAISDRSFTIGIEQEYLLVDPDSHALSPAPDGLMHACQCELGDQVSPLALSGNSRPSPLFDMPEGESTWILR